MRHDLHFDGPVWRLLPEGLSATPMIAAQAPEGRFHHSGQVAAYASLSAEGAFVAMRRYFDDGINRVLIPMWLKSDRVIDQRGNARASVVWQDDRAAGKVSPTWAFSDAARNVRAQAMLYSSRSRPELSHVVIFETECLSYIGPVTTFGPDKEFTTGNKY